jgi:hypothetical protein
VCTCLRGRIVTLETSDASRFLFAPHRTFSHGSPHRSLRGSNASRQSVFYCVHAQEASIINLDHDLLPSAYDPPPPSPSSFGSPSLPLLAGSLCRSSVRKELSAVKRLSPHCEQRASVRIDRIPLFSIRQFQTRLTYGEAKRVRITNAFCGYLENMVNDTYIYIFFFLL